MKQCSKCGRLLPLLDFQLRDAEKGTFRNHCSDCRPQYNHAYYREHSEKYKALRRQNQPRYREERRSKLREYLAGRTCVDCGNTDAVVLEFDHAKGEKFVDIGTMLSHYSWTRILAEIEKCEIRCANCHRRKTARDFKWFKGDIGA